MRNWSRDFYWTREFVRELEMIEDSLRQRLARGEPASTETYNAELRKWEALPRTRSLFTPYYRAQVCYVLIHRSEINGFPPPAYEVPAEILAWWGEDIARDGLQANVIFPDDRKMRNILSRPSRFNSILWEEQGHQHQADGMSLIERIYYIHEQLENGGKEYV